MPIPVDAVFDAAERVKDVIVAAYESDGIELPQWRMVTAEMPAYEQDMLVVVAENTYGQDGNVSAEQVQPIDQHAAFWLRGMTVAAVLLRCLPMVQQSGVAGASYPTPAKREEAARLIYSDGLRMLNALAAAQKARQLAGGHSLAFQRWDLIEPRGGLGGGILRVRIGLGV